MNDKIAPDHLLRMALAIASDDHSPKSIPLGPLSDFAFLFSNQLNATALSVLSGLCVRNRLESRASFNPSLQVILGVEMMYRDTIFQ